MGRDAKWGVVELFTGIGGVAQGFAAQGHFEIIALTDIDADARDTSLENFPQFPKEDYIIKDVRDLPANCLRDAANGRPIHGLLGCPPCQGFSSAGKRDPSDKRNLLMDDYIRLVRELRPKFFVLENVPHILLDKKFQTALTFLQEDLDYRVWAGTLNAALYGLPQTRQRAIVIGFGRTLNVTPTPPPPTHCGRRKVFDYATQQFVSPCAPDGWWALGIYPELRRIGNLSPFEAGVGFLCHAG